MVRRIKSAGTGDNFLDLVRQLRTIKNTKAELEKRQKEVTALLKDYLDEHGEPDDKGHLVYVLPEEVDGTKSLIKQRKVQTSLNEESLEAWLEEKGLREKVIATREFLDKDKVASLIYTGEMTEEDFAAHVESKVSWALMEGKA